MYTRKRKWPDFNPDMEYDRDKRPCLSNQNPKRIPFSSFISQLNNVLTNYPQKLLHFLQSHCFELGQTVQCTNLSSEEVYTLIRGLSEAMECAKTLEEVQAILAETLQPTFIARDLLFFISQIDAFHLYGQINSKVIENTVVLLHHLVTAAPEKTQQLLYLPVDLLYSKLQRQQAHGCKVSWIIQKQLQDLKWMVDAGIPEKGNFMLSTFEEQIHKISVFPRPEDILTQPGHALRPNPKSGSHESEKAYLDLHFQLLREDFIKPLRDGITSCFTIRPLFSDAQTRSKGLRLYHNVHIVKVATMPTGVIYMARFDSPFTSFVSSKRLMSGSLVCLISNECDDILFGTVASYDRKQLVEGSVWLDLKLNLQDLYKYFHRMRFTMVESPAFFEAYRHVLEGLQEFDHRLLPFRRYIVDCETSVYSPYYLDDAEIEYDLTTLNPSHRVAGKKQVVESKVLARQNHISATENCSKVLKSSCHASSSYCAMIPSVSGKGLKNTLVNSPYKFSVSPHILMQQKPLYHALALPPTSKLQAPQFQAGISQVQCTPAQAKDMSSQIQAAGSQVQSTTPQVHVAAPQEQGTPRQVSASAPQVQCTPQHISDTAPQDQCKTLQVQGMVHQVHCAPLEFQAIAPQVPGTATQDKRTPLQVPATTTQVQCPPLEIQATAPQVQCIQQGLQHADQNISSANLMAPSSSMKEAKKDDEVAPSPSSQMDEDISQGLLGTEVKLVDIPAPSIDAPCLGTKTLGSGNNMNMCAADPFNPLIWSPENFPLLDESQVKAIEMALTREFVLIQGPPGTGKTFIGLKIVETLLRNDRYWNTQKSPLLVVCYTNHALDQFLEGILQFQRTGVVRIGGRSKNNNMEAYSLKNIRKKRLRELLLPSQRRRFAEIMEPLRHLRMVIPDYSALMETLHCGILTEQELGPEIQADKLKYITILGQSQMLKWLNIFPQEQKPNTRIANRKEQNSTRDSSDFQHEGEDRFLDDDEYDYGGESKQQWLESKFAYIVPEQPSKWDAEILSSLEEDDIMTQEEVPLEHQLWLLSKKDRWRLYRKWLHAYKNKLKELLNCNIKEYADGTAKMMELTVQENQLILKEALVIGMTTTGAAKYRSLLQKIKPKIVVVEEAAEVLEAHVLTTLNTSCQHLIMIGDHKQLRPKPADYTLEKKYNLGISLFERMINNNLPYVQLVYQHRMRPEISQLLVPLFYTHLKDHESVSHFENIRGVDSNIFFIQHKEEEDKNSDSESCSNMFEASFLVYLCKYLLKQNYREEQITILTPYTGQLLILRQMIKEEELIEVMVKAVDDFQGEENDIILLSLVRSNKEGQIGFMKDKNRMCVAFSRARIGFFCIGNLLALSEGSKNRLWKDITKFLEEKNLTGEGLTLTCQNHPEIKTVVKKRSDFRKVSQGGCHLPCQTRLKCGHPCRRSCHPFDMEHQDYRCKFLCKKITCPLMHECPKKCSEPCGPCVVKVEKIFPNCGHTQMIACWKTPVPELCESPCERQLMCKHACTLTCNKECSDCKCLEMIDLPLPCNHIINIECHEQNKPQICQEKCKEFLDCGHKCKGTCHKCIFGRLHVGCTQPCTRVLLCSHVCKGTCRDICPPCPQKCSNKCMHSRCDKRCGEICFQCILPCSWACDHHTCKKICYEVCDRPRCNMPCKKILKCSHPCVGLCGEKCPNLCRVCDKDKLTEIFFGTEDEPEARFVILEDCRHIFEVSGLDHWMDGDGEAKNQHVQMKMCPRCSVPIQWNTRYSNVIKEIRQKIDMVKQKIQGSEKEIEDEQERLLHCVRSSKIISILQEKDIEQKLSTTLSLQGLKDVENTLNFYTSLSKLRIQAKKCADDRGHTLRMAINDVEDWLCKTSLPFTQQQRKECRNEVKRISYLGNIFERLSFYESKSWEQSESTLELVIEALETLNKCPLTEATNSSLQGTLQKIDELLPVSGLHISEAERVMIISAMVMGKGHWYSCPKGHLYTIGECGRPMQESSCPDCGASIGGQSHNLVQGNATTEIILNPLPEQPLTESQ